MVYLGGNDLENSNIDYKKEYAKSEEKINELNNIIADQEKEIELLKYFTNNPNATNNNSKSSKDVGKNYLKTIEENGKLKF